MRVQAEMDEMSARLKSALENSSVSLKVSDEVASALQASAAIMLRWDSIKSKDLPEELASALEQQRRACEGVLKGKAQVLEFLRQESLRKEHSFAMLLDSQRQALDTLMRKMRSAYLETREGCGTRVREIEEAFLAERTEIVAAQRRELDGILEVRRGLEERYVEEQLAREEQHSQELYAIQLTDMENFQKLKHKLERDVMMLEQQLEAIKFTYLLNKGESGFLVLGGAPHSFPYTTIQNTNAPPPLPSSRET